MKQSEIQVGKSYLFFRTNIWHKKDMVGTIVKVVGSRTGKKSITKNHGMSVVTQAPKRYKLDNGRSANAAELQEIK